MNNHLGKYEIISVNDVTIDARVQQQFRPSKVTRMVKDGFDPSLAGTITVSRRNTGALIVLDGQHRVKAAIEVGITHLPALVHEGLTLAEEASFFLGLNAKSNPTAVAKFLVSVVSGDKDDTAIKNIIEQYGWRIREGSTRDGGIFNAVKRAQDIYGLNTKFFSDSDVFGNQLLDASMEALTEAWGTKNSLAVKSTTLGGIAIFFKRYWGDIDTDRLIRQLGTTDPDRFAQDAKGVQDSMKLSAVESAGFSIHRLYNHGARHNRKLDTWFM